MFPIIDKVRDTLRYQQNWKATGFDRVYNFFIKQMKSLHKSFYKIIKGIFVEAYEPPS
ncbi:hypothetical protein NUSPORA_01986 [Nucleospora cyclopteri]